MGPISATPPTNIKLRGKSVFERQQAPMEEGIATTGGWIADYHGGPDWPE